MGRGKKKEKEMEQRRTHKKKEPRLERGKVAESCQRKKIKCKRKGGRIGRRERQKKKRKIRKECEKRMKGW